MLLVSTYPSLLQILDFGLWFRRLFIQISMLCALLVLLNGLGFAVMLAVCCIYRREIATAATVGRKLANNMSSGGGKQRGGEAIGSLLLSSSTASSTTAPGIRFQRNKKE